MTPFLASPLAAPEPSPTNKIAVAALWGLIAVGLGTMTYLIVRGPAENPARGVRRSPNVGRSPPIVKGRSTRFEMVEGPDVTCAGGMIHDPSGRAWPRNSVLCGPFRPRVRAATSEEYRGWAKDYLGSSHRPMVGVVDTPPRALGGWDYMGEVEKIYYTRIGAKRPGRYVHTFNKPSALATLVRGKGRVRLYRRGRFVRIDLPRGAQRRRPRLRLALVKKIALICADEHSRATSRRATCRFAMTSCCIARRSTALLEVALPPLFRDGGSSMICFDTPCRA